MLTIRLLGQLSVARDGETLALPQSKKTRGLLAYLAVTGRSHRRDRLCDILWDIPDDPRGALRWSLSKLRPLVNEPETDRIVADRDSVFFDSKGASVDVLAVRAAMADGLDHVAVDDLKALESEFRGEFLEGLDLNDCMDFHAWCVAERDECQQLHARILEALVQKLADAPNEALPFARKLVDCDPANDRAHATLISLLTATERRAEAERQYKASRQTLEALGHPSVDDLLPNPSYPPRTTGQRIGITRDLTEQTAMGRDAELGQEQEIRFCAAKDGTRIAYATAGSGPPLVKAANWLNHLEFDWESPVWRHMLRALSRDHLLVRYDERGNGLSDWDVDDISFDAFVDDLESVVDAAGLDRFALLGISQGCAVSIAYAVRHPERVTHMVLHGGYAAGWAVRGASAEIERRRALLTLTREGWGQENPAFRQVFTSLYVPDGNPEQMDWWNELQRVTTSPENAARLQLAFSEIDVRDLMGRVSVPTLVTHCRNDAALPFETGRELAMSIPGARFVPLDSRNHLILEQEPAWDRFLAETEGFLKTPPAAEA